MLCIFNAGLNQVSTAHAFFMRDQCYVTLLSRCLRSTCLCRRRGLTFSSVCPACLGFSAHYCALVPLTQVSTLIPCQMKDYSNNIPCLTLLYQEIDELLPKPLGGHVVSLSCQEVERSEDESSPLNGSDFRSIQHFRLMGEAKHTLLCIILPLQPLLSITAAK